MLVCSCVCVCMCACLLLCVYACVRVYVLKQDLDLSLEMAFHYVFHIVIELYLNISEVNLPVVYLSSGCGVKFSPDILSLYQTENNLRRDLLALYPFKIT